ncbi:GNAT family N-acetyltransferase [Riemerella anatipestifer]|nr:GNAT family N-acetyltransferase [Riemerella anatipestifer]
MNFAATETKTNTMNFRNNQTGNGGFISMSNDTEEIGRLTYTILPEKQQLIISFVNIFPKFEGRGLGKALIKEAISFAREHQWTIYPHCSYARAVMMRMEHLDDVFPSI